MKYLAMTPHRTGEDVPSQEVEEEVVRSIRSLGLQVPAVQEGWHKESTGLVEICSKPFPGARPIWYWEVK